MIGINETCPVCLGRRTIRAIKLHPVHVFEYVDEPCACNVPVQAAPPLPAIDRREEALQLIDSAIEAPIPAPIQISPLTYKIAIAMTGYYAVPLMIVHAITIEAPLCPNGTMSGTVEMKFSEFGTTNGFDVHMHNAYFYVYLPRPERIDRVAKINGRYTVCVTLLGTPV